MSRYERSRYFERLCALRATYENLPVADTTATISIAEVIAFATQALDAVPVNAEADAQAETAGSGSADHLN